MVKPTPPPLGRVGAAPNGEDGACVVAGLEAPKVKDGPPDEPGG